MTTATLTSKGQVTIPKQVRESLHLHSGDRIEFSIRGNSEALLKPITRTVSDVFGCLHQSNQKAVSIDKMNEAIAQRVRERNV